MIAKLTGRVDSSGDGWAVVDVGGVGYLVFCSGRTLARLEPGAATSLQVETHVREDAIHLYGFLEAAERQWFRMLNAVQGVGAKVALAILTVLAPHDLALAVAAGDKAAIARSPGVGPRLAETVVAVIDDPKRFKNAKQVGAYAGLVPRQIESGTMTRTGRITGRGNKLLRGLLVEVAWLMRRYNGHLRNVFDRVCRGSRTRKKIAVVATARRLLVICWAMLRDGTRWRNPDVAAG